MVDPQVTIVVTPRERFSFTREALESIYENTDIPFKLVYVDGGSPLKTQRYLEAQAREKEFQIIRTDYYLSPNHARNLSLGQVNTKYVVFIDNDVLASPGWLGSLVECAEETGASVISPLICVGKPEDGIIHCAGGEAKIVMQTKGDRVKRRIHEKMYGRRRRVVDVRDQLKREPTGLAEFHCMFVRTEIFERVGYFDEALLNTREHIDFCMEVTQAGGTVYLEPASIVTYVPGPPIEWTDIPFYMLRWSDKWAVTSLRRLRDKWDLSEEEAPQMGEKLMSWRRKKTIISPLAHNLTFGRGSVMLEKTLLRIEGVLNRYISNRYDRLQPRRRQEKATTQLHESPTTASSRG